MNRAGKQVIKILHIEDVPTDAKLVERELLKADLAFEKIVVDNRVKFEQALDSFVPDIILSDHSLPSFDSIQALRILRDKGMAVPFILITSAMSDEMAISIMKEGANDYILKDRLTRLPEAIFNLLEKSRLEKEKATYLDTIAENEKRFRAIVEKGNDMIILSSRDSRILYASNNITKFLGYSPEELYILFSLDFIHPDELQEYLSERNQLIENPGASFYHQLRIRHKDGSWIWCEFNVTNMLHEKGINGLVLNFRDISERKKIEQLRQYDQNNLNALINNTHDLMWSVDKDFKLITSNKPFDDMVESIFGRKIEKGENILDPSSSPEMRRHFENIYRRALSGESFVEIEHWQQPFEFWSEVSYYPILHAGEVVGSACHSRNITEIIRDKKKIRDSEEFIRGVLNSLKSHIAVIDDKGFILAVNDSWTKFAVANRDQGLVGTGVGVNYFEVCESAVSQGVPLAAEALQGLKDVLNGVIEDFYLEYPCHSPFEKTWFGMRVVSFDNKVVASHQNITERVKAQNLLRESTMRLEETQAIAQIGSWEIDLKRGTHLWSDELFKIFGVEKTVTPSMGLFLLVIHPDDLDSIVNISKSVLATCEESSFNFRFIRPVDGQIHYAYCEYKFEFNRNHKPVRMFGFIQNQTEIKAAEQEIVKKNDQLRDLSNHLQKIREDERKNVAREIHDELGQQLTALKLDIDWILHKQRNAEERVISKLNDMLKMNDGIINTVRRISSDLRPPILDDLGLIATIEWKCFDFEEKTGVPCFFLTDVRESYYMKDFSINIYRILQESLTNISRYAEAKSVTVEFDEDESAIRLRITDDGKGIHLSEILNTERLGILGMKERATLLGGSLTVEPGKDRGTVVTLELPVPDN